MKKRMLIDAEYLEETRVVVTNDNELKILITRPQQKSKIEETYI